MKWKFPCPLNLVRLANEPAHTLDEPSSSRTAEIISYRSPCPLYSLLFCLVNSSHLPDLPDSSPQVREPLGSA